MTAQSSEDHKRIFDAQTEAIELLHTRLPEVEAIGVMTDDFVASTGKGGEVYSRRILKRLAKKYCRAHCCAAKPLSKSECQDCSLYEFLKYLKEVERMV